MADEILGEAFKGGGITSKNSPAGYAWHQFVKLAKGEAVEKESEDKKEKVSVVPLELTGYAETVRADGLWCKHAFGMEKLKFTFKDAQGEPVEVEWDTKGWNDPYKKHQGTGYKDAFANKRDKDKAPPYKGICLHHTDTDQLGAALAQLTGVGKKTSAPYVIDTDGTIYELYDPDEHWGVHTGHAIDERTIGVFLVNRGAIAEEEAKEMKAGKAAAFVFTAAEPFREQPHWQHYTAEQNTALVQLVRWLCARYNIPKRFASDDIAKISEYVESKTGRDLIIGIFAHSNLSTLKHDPGPALPWAFFVQEVKKPAPEDTTVPPGPSPTQNPLGTGAYDYPIDIAKYMELATTPAGLTERQIEGGGAYGDLMKISRRVGLDTSEWKAIEEGAKPPYGPFPVFVDGTFNEGVKIGLPTEWGEIAGKLEVRAVADGLVLFRGGENESEPGKHEVGFMLVQHRTPDDKPFVALYANLVGLDSTVGDTVAALDFLGYVGAHPRFPHVHVAFASAERIPPFEGTEDAKQLPGMNQDELLALGADGRDMAWAQVVVACEEPPVIFQLAGLKGKTYLYNPIHFVRWLRGEAVDVSIANAPVEAEVEEFKADTAAGMGHPPVSLLQCKPFVAEPELQIFFARTVIKPLDQLDREKHVLIEGCESRGAETRKCVAALQKALASLGYLSLDLKDEKKLGVYGPETSAAVNKFETRNQEAMTYSDGTQLQPNGECDWVTLKAIDAALCLIERRPMPVVGLGRELPNAAAAVVPRGSPPVVVEDGKVVLPERWVYMDGSREMNFADLPGFLSLKDLKPRTRLFCYLQGGKHEFARAAFEDERKTNWGPSKAGNLPASDYLIVHREELDIAPPVASVLMAALLNEPNLDAVNGHTRGYFSVGMTQLSLHNGELVRFLLALKKKDQGVFDTYFGSSGLAVEEKDKVLTLSLDKEVLFKTGTLPARGRNHPLSKLQTLKWAYLFYAAARDPKVAALQFEQAAAQIRELYEKLTIKEKPLKEWLSSQLGVALVFDQHLSMPTRVRASMEKALAEAEAELGAFDAKNQEHHDVLVRCYVAQRCQSLMWDPWNRADRIKAVADKRQAAPVEPRAPGTTNKWEEVWKQLWEKDHPTPHVEKFWGFTLDRAPGSFEAK